MRILRIIANNDNSLPANVQNKVKYAMNILADVKVVNTKLIKKLVDTDFYELRISVGNTPFATIIIHIVRLAYKIWIKRT